MDSQSFAAVAFKDGIARVLSTLTDAIDDKTATMIIRFALSAVDKDAEKLKILVIMIYNSTTLSSECVAKLLVKLLDLTPPLDIQDYMTTEFGKLVLRTSLNMTEWLVLQECKSGFKATITQVNWSPKSLIVAEALYKAGYPTEYVFMRFILSMVESDHLFVPQNFELFVNTCLLCGPTLGCKIGTLTAAINKVSARVPAESSMFKLALAGLVAARNNNWIVETNTAPQVSPKTESSRVSTPETDSTI